MIVFDPYNPENRIERPAFLRATFGDDTPTIYAVPADSAARWIEAWSRHGATVEQMPAADAKAYSEARGFVGILLTKSEGCAAWGNCHFTEASS